MIWTRAYRPFALLLLLDTAAFLLQKFASTRADGEGLVFLGNLLVHPWVWLPLALGPVQLWLWTRILSKTDLSLAYPLTSLAFPMTMILAAVFFREHLPWPVWVGAALITLGVSMMGEHKDELPAPPVRAEKES